MYRDRTKSPKSQNVRNQGPIRKVDAFHRVKEIMSKKVKSPLLKEIVAHADISSVLKEPADPLQDDVGEDSFNPPLHSTAVYTEDDEPLQTSGIVGQIPAKLMSPIPPVVQEKRKQNQRESKSKPSTSTEASTHRPDTTKPKRTPKKKAVYVAKPGTSKKHGTARNRADGSLPSTQAANTSKNRKAVSAAKAQRKEQNTSSKKKSKKDKMRTASADSGSPDNEPKSVRNVNELDVVHFECGKLIELYREKVETDVCKRAIDVFCHSFKEQLSTTISDLRKLKELKRKNAKMQLEIGRKRKHLLEVKNDIIAKQPKLNQLQKECTELQQQRESLKKARSFLDDLAHLQDDYLKFKAKKPNIKETYGMSSLPALCLETEHFMKAEQHFHILNRQLQSIIDQEEGDK